MGSQLRPALVLLVALHVLTGVVYPLARHRHRAGRLSRARPTAASSSWTARPAARSLIGQPFDDPKYFWGRPVGDRRRVPYNAAASSGSNLGPTNPALLDAVRGRIDGAAGGGPGRPDPIPVDLVTASGSGLDPDISLAGRARAGARGSRGRAAWPRRRSASSSPAHAAGRTLGFLGEPRVNVLLLNLALDADRSRGRSGFDRQASRIGVRPTT